MAQDGGKQQNTAYGVFVQACWAQHKRQYPDELIHKEIEEFNKQCSVWWYNLSEQERERFQEMADRSNAAAAATSQQSAANYVQINNAAQMLQQQQQAAAVQQQQQAAAVAAAQQQQQAAQQQQNLMAIHNAAISSAGGIPSFGSSFNYASTSAGGNNAATTAIDATTAYAIHNGQQHALAQGSHVVNALVDNTGTVLNYSTNAAAAVAAANAAALTQQHGQQGLIQQRVMGANAAGLMQTQALNRAGLMVSGHHQGTTGHLLATGALNGGGQVLVTGGLNAAAATALHQTPQLKANGKPMKDPNAPKKPLSAYFLFSSDERIKVKAQYPDYSITEVAKELGRRWASIDPSTKAVYEAKYQDAKRIYESAMTAYKPQKKKKDPNAPRQPLSAYFLFSNEERAKVKEINPSYTICDIAKELGRRWAEMAPEVKQRYQQMAEQARQRYDREMALYRQNSFNPNNSTANNTTALLQQATNGGAGTPTANSPASVNGSSAVPQSVASALVANATLVSSASSILGGAQSLAASGGSANGANAATALTLSAAQQHFGGASNGASPTVSSASSVVGNGASVVQASATDYASLLQ